MSEQRANEVRYYRARVNIDVLFSSRDNDSEIAEYGRSILAAASDGLLGRHAEVNYADESIEMVELTPAEKPVDIASGD